MKTEKTASAKTQSGSRNADNELHCPSLSRRKLIKHILEKIKKTMLFEEFTTRIQLQSPRCLTSLQPQHSYSAPTPRLQANMDSHACDLQLLLGYGGERV